MKNGLARVAALTAALFSCAASAALAEPVEATLGLTVNAMTGSHEVNGGQVDKVQFAPLPLAELTLRHGSDTLRIEGLPPVAFGYGSTGDAALSTRLSIVTATYRRTLGGGWFVGAGQTVYNQYTTYAPVRGTFAYTRGFTVDPIDGSEVQYSRVTGMRIEAGRTFSLGRDRIETSVSGNPRMRGVQYTRIPTAFSACSFGATAVVCNQIVDTFADPESASQVDVAARVAHPLSKHGELLYGLRYLNYSAHYDAFPGQLADRNVGFAPVLGYRLKL
ncbi:MAG TPA: hypothetical protein VGD01_06835 [Candidatus Elarobacter sp.]